MWAPKTFRDYDIPEGRTPESYAYRIEEVWDGVVTDVLYTDDPAEVQRIVPLSLDQLYRVRVTRDGTTVEHWPEDG